MASFDDINEPVLRSPLGRKRERQPDNYERNKARKARHSGEGKIPNVACAHNAPGLCLASTLSQDEITHMHGLVYATSIKVQQDAILLSYMNVQKVKRRRQKRGNQDLQKSRDFSVQYFIMKEDKKKVPLCKASFMSICCVKKDRIANIAKYWFEHGVAMPEKRGGARNVDKYATKREHVKEHIETFTCRASHYARRGAPGRKYLPAELNVKKMHDLFRTQNHEQISYAFYYSVFMYNFNLGFGHPAKDICSECVKFRIKIKDPELTNDEKRIQTALFILHRRRARKFYDIMNAVEDTFTVCFDIMENLVLPKSPTSLGQTYYSRQLYMYVFGVVRHRGRGQTQGKEDLHLFVWLEHQNRKDSNMVASALHYYFNTVVRQELRQCQTLRLFSDSCYGQNKNINVLSMLFAMRKQKFQNLRIEYNFPIRGHSFLPADRAFGRIEQDIRKKETILLPSEYLDIIRKHGSVHADGEYWQCLDFKAAAAGHCSSNRSFKISAARVLEINGDTVGLKQSYNAEFCYHSIMKRGKTWDNFKPSVVPMISCVKEAKKTDVFKLLDALGANATVRQYYEDALADPKGDTVGRQDLEESSDEE